MRYTNLDTDNLRTFVLGVELGGFARAATRVGRSQSAVSGQMRKLEEQIGQPLLRRAGRGLELTEAGERLLGYARRMVETNDEAVACLRGAPAEGSVRLGLPQDFAEAWLPEVLGRFADAHPQVQVDVRAEKVALLVDKTVRGELDLCLNWGPAGGAPFVETVAEIPMVWVAHASWPGRDPSHRAPLPLIAFESPCAFREAAIAALDRAGVAWRIAVSSPSLSSLWAAAAAGLGVTVRTRIGLPSSLAVLAPEPSGLPKLPRVSLTLIRAGREAGRATAHLSSILLDVMRERLEASETV